MVPITTSDGTLLEKPLLVIPDLISRQGDHTKVHEIKTSGRAYSESEVATSLQPTCYGHAVNELTGEDPIVEFTVLIKTKSPRLQRIEAPRNTADYQRLGDLIATVEKAVDSGIFYPVESPINCSSCAYFKACRDWTGTQGFTEPPILRAEAVHC
jgi:CRISPR/Cas system-associated exonuclease Cas4 (RecB family)